MGGTENGGQGPGVQGLGSQGEEHGDSGGRAVGHGDWGPGVGGMETGGQGWGAWGLGSRGGGQRWQGQRQPEDCLLSSSDTQYKMTISMADWPSEASEVRRWSGRAPGRPPLGWGTGLRTGLQAVCPSTCVSQGTVLGTQP